VEHWQRGEMGNRSQCTGVCAGTSGSLADGALVLSDRGTDEPHHFTARWPISCERCASGHHTFYGGFDQATQQSLETGRIELQGTPLK
jgi:hypothetical protein